MIDATGEMVRGQARRALLWCAMHQLFYMFMK